MIEDIFTKIGRNSGLTQSEIEELRMFMGANHNTTAKLTNIKTLDEITYDLGDMIAGRFISPADPNDNNPDSSTFTGTYQSSDGIFGKNAGTTQFSLSSTDGKATAGAGTVTIDADGVTIASGGLNPNAIKFTGGGVIQSFLRNVYSGNLSITTLENSGNAAGQYGNVVYLQAVDGGGTAFVKAWAHDNAGQYYVELNAPELKFTGTPSGNITGGTYTPTPTKVTNFTTGTVTMRTCQYMRVGSVVTVSGAFNADPDATGSCVFTFTLPIASNLANSYELAGAGATDQTTPVALMIRGSSTADAAVVSWSATTASAQEAYFTLTYRII